jgi:hypothetical protein
VNVREYIHQGICSANGVCCLQKCALAAKLQSANHPLHAPEQPEMLLTGPFCVLIKSFCATPATRFLALQMPYLHLAHLHNAFHNPLMLQLLDKSLCIKKK